jgi:hypothetical protein
MTLVIENGLNVVIDIVCDGREIREKAKMLIYTYGNKVY